MPEPNDLFDRSFDHFLEHLNNDPSFTTFDTNDTSFDKSFDSAGFKFSAAVVKAQHSPAGSRRSTTTLFPFDPFQIEDPNTAVNTTLNTTATTTTTASSTPIVLSRPRASPVRVFVHEQVSALYDDFSSEGSVSVTGSVRIKASSSSSRASSNDNTESSTIFLRLKDPHSCLQRVQQGDDVSCQLTRDDQGQRSLRIKLEKSQASREVHVADFFCVASLRPVPLVSCQVAPHHQLYNLYESWIVILIACFFCRKILTNIIIIYFTADQNQSRGREWTRTGRLQNTRQSAHGIRSARRDHFARRPTGRGRRTLQTVACRWILGGAQTHRLVARGPD